MEKLEKFKKHILLPQIGIKGQNLAISARILIVGLGGLGNPLIRYLAAAGIGNFTIIDDDIIELDNLPRQNNYRIFDLDQTKVDVTEELILALNPEAKVKKFFKRLDQAFLAENLATENYDLIADCSDNFKSKFLIADFANHRDITFVSSGFSGFKGYCGVYKKGFPCFRCFHDAEILHSNEERACFNTGVFSAGVGVVGTFMAAEILKEIMRIKESLAGKIMIFDFLRNNHRIVKISKLPSCLCSKLGISSKFSVDCDVAN